MTPAQSRLARAALRWSIRETATKANVSPSTIVRFERGEDTLRSSAAKLERAYTNAGVQFIGRTGVKLAEDES